LSSPFNFFFATFTMGKKQASTEGHKSGQSNEPISKPAHALPWKQVVEEIQCNPDDGLTTAEAKSRHEKYGNNDLGDDGGVSPGKILVRQVANAMTLVCQLPRDIWTLLTFSDSHRCHGRQFCYSVMD
jgi:magnesium-transporting ATPase (P-type)